MAIKKNSTKSAKKTKSAAKSASPRRRGKAAQRLSPDQQREISAVFLAALAILVLLGCINVGGSLVTGMFGGLRVGMGYAAYLLPLVLGALAFMLFQPERYLVKGRTYVGYLGILASMATLFHIGIHPD